MAGPMHNNNKKGNRKLHGRGGKVSGVSRGGNPKVRHHGETKKAHTATGKPKKAISERRRKQVVGEIMHHGGMGRHRHE